MTKALLVICILTSLATSSRCSLPEDITNFQNEYVCAADVRLVRPLTVIDVEKAVALHGRVKAVGYGHSFNRIYCSPSPSTTAESSDTSANIVMTTIRPLKIHVKESDQSVWVSAGVIIRDLVEYLANYVTPAAPRGYSMMAVPGYDGQSIAGAVATGTHGSSLRHGSFSNQVLAFRVILANGTTVEISEKDNSFLMRAFRVNVGRLGVVTDVKLKIYPETLARRILKSAIPSNEFMIMFRHAQEMYKSTGSLPDWLSETRVFWMPTNSTFEISILEIMQETSNRTKAECLHEKCHVPTLESIVFLENLKRSKINTPVNMSRATGASEISEGVQWETPMPFPPNLALIDPNVSSAREDGIALVIRTLWNNATVETHRAFPIPEGPNFALQLGDDYSISIPANKMADCFEHILSMVESAMPDNGLRGFQSLRFVGKEDALLSSSNSHPQLRLDLIDSLYYNRQNRSSNVPLKQLLGFIVTSPLCSPVRLHWGKAGWPDPGCWNGAVIYKETWCDFGCAVLELDPYDKFVGGDPTIWNWNGANLETCCTPDGYDTSLEGCGCDVIPVRTPDECPEAPFFTYR